MFTGLLHGEEAHYCHLHLDSLSPPDQRSEEEGDDSTGGVRMEAEPNWGWADGWKMANYCIS